MQSYGFSKQLQIDALVSTHKSQSAIFDAPYFCIMK